MAITQEQLNELYDEQAQVEKSNNRIKEILADIGAPAPVPPKGGVGTNA